MKTVFFCVVLTFLCNTLMAQSKTTVKKTVVKSTLSATGLASALARGKVVYAANCLACHQADGSGVPNLNPPLIQTSWVLGSKAVLINQVLKGSKGKVEIDGDRFENAMPAQAHLSDQQIADVLTYVRNSFGNKATAVAPTEVKSERAKKNYNEKSIIY
jgi:mono/diheme cytochrome c family protein